LDNGNCGSGMGRDRITDLTSFTGLLSCILHLGLDSFKYSKNERIQI